MSAFPATTFEGEYTTAPAALSLPLGGQETHAPSINQVLSVFPVRATGIVGLPGYLGSRVTRYASPPGIAGA